MNRYALCLLLTAIMTFGRLSAFAQTVLTDVSTDKAVYSPGQVVTLTATTNQSQTGLTLKASYFYLETVFQTQIVSLTGTSATWTWTAPSNDHLGYMILVELMNGSVAISSASVGVNVTSNPSKFPIYGFLSNFPSMTAGQMDSKMKTLNRYHINHIQFYDWADSPHDPLSGTASSPSTSWNDVANRTMSFETVKGYIDRGHNNHSMRSMFYNLGYGSYSNWSFQPENYLYNDAAHSQKWHFDYGVSGWEAPGYNIMNTNDPGWRGYFLGNINEVYTATNLHFDGWQVDQIGNGGFKYNSSGTQVDVAQTFPTLLQAAKTAQPSKYLVMNAVDTYGQSLIAAQSTEFLYTEMWPSPGSTGTYQSIRDVITTNEGYAPTKKNVFAAYVGRARSGAAGVHSHGAVLLCDATMLALGGQHLELGEHMLCNEYFPNNNLSMSSNLTAAVKRYYDFAVGYENLLRDGRVFNTVTLNCSNRSDVTSWPPQLGKIATLGVTAGTRKVFHLLNYRNATSLNWADDQPEPTPITSGIALWFSSASNLGTAWFASPDYNNGLPVQLSTLWNNSAKTIAVTLPYLGYWSMLWFEPAGARLGTDEGGLPIHEASMACAPNPFTGSTGVSFTLPCTQYIVLSLYDSKGEEVRTLEKGTKPAGTYTLPLDGTDLVSGLYTLRFTTQTGTQTRRIIKE